MTFENPAARQPTEQPRRVRAVVQPTPQPVATVETVSAQLEQQTKVLQAMNQELAALRTVQAAQGETLAKIDRYLRWVRWGRRIRRTFWGLCWLGVAAVIVYYWADLAEIWAELASFLL